MNKFNVLALAMAATAVLTARVAQAGAALNISGNISGGTAAPVEVSDVLTGTPAMALSSAAVGIGSLDVWFVQDGFSLPSATVKSSLVSTLDASIGTGSLRQEACVFAAGSFAYDCSVTSLPLDTTAINAPNTILSSVEYKGVPDTMTGTGEYAITMHAQLNHGSFGHSAIDSNIVLPEPASLALVGLGLLGLGAARRRIRS